MNFRKRSLLIFLLLFTVSPLFSLTLKMASIFPEGSAWHLTLQDMAQKWREISGGRIKIRIYPGGIAGNELDSIRKMRIGQIDMTVVSSIGLNTIVSDSFIMSLPFFYRNDAELDYTIRKMTPVFEDDFVDKGFRVLAWSKSGWVYFFSESPAAYPEDFGEFRLAVSPTEPVMLQAFKDLGLNVIPTSAKDILMALQSGRADAYYAPAMASAAYQWFGVADQMLDMKVSPVIGGILISERTWRRIPSRYKEELKAATAAVASAFYRESLALEKQAMDVMLANGLSVNPADTAVRQAWRDLMGDDYSAMVGGSRPVSRDIFNDVKRMLEDFRRRN